MTAVKTSSITVTTTTTNSNNTLNNLRIDCFILETTNKA